jgi:hypothetical protein
MVGPVSQRHVHEDGTDTRSSLAKASFFHVEQLMKEHPEIQIAMFVLWTPRPDNHPRGASYDDVHTAVVGTDRVPMRPDQLMNMLDQTIPTLIQMRVMLENEPENVLKKPEKT